jgi:hypothetical protein
MRWLSRLLVVVILCLIAIALPSVPTQAQCGGPSIELSPKSGLPGTEVTVDGHNFAAGVLVDIKYDGDLVTTGTTSSKGDFTLAFTVPEGCQGPHEVFVRGKYATVDTYFTVKPGLIVSPEEGPVGTTVAVQGKGFARNEEGIELLYYLNGNYETVESNITANSKGSWQTSFQIPLSSSGKHKIDAGGNESRLYQVQDATFRVTAATSLNTLSGTVGQNITMRGSRFAADEKGIKILFDSQAVVTGIKADSQGDWEATFQVPEMPTGEYDVTAEGESTKKEDITALSFQIKPDIVLSPDTGHVGTNLTVAGQGFAPGEKLVITYNNTQVAAPTASDKGSFDVSFLVPESTHGEHQVTAGYAGQNHANAIFTMESDPPPTPALISPANRNRMGFMGKVAPTFEWSAVSDDSGVRYCLQIASSANVTATGEFVYPLVSVEGLVGTNYTLNATEALSHGTYYWIVQAVDGAENAGDWSTAYSLRVGGLPKWGLILIIVATVVLIGALVRAVVTRRRYYY